MTQFGTSKCPGCKHFEYQHGQHGCLAHDRRDDACGCTQTLTALVANRTGSRRCSPQ